MIKQSLIFLLILLFISEAGSQNPLVELEKKKLPNFYEIKEAYEQYWNSIPEEKRKGWKQYKRWEYFWGSRVGKDGQFPDARRILNEFNKFKKNESNTNQASDPQWKLIGPIGTPTKATLDKSQGIGRINVVRIHPANANIIWAGTALGGLWKTTNGGKAWAEVPYTQFLSLGNSDVAVSSSDPNIIYVATGDDDGIVDEDRSYYSIGIIKSTDGGTTWEQTGLFKELEHTYIVTRLLIDPTKPDIVIATTSDGIYKTTDGGKTWVSKYNQGDYYRDLEMCPNNPTIIYASTHSKSGSTAILKSVDQGDTWTVVKQFNNVVRIELAVTRDDAKYVYALAASSANNGFQALLVSSDQGKTWTEKYSVNNGLNLLGWFDGTGYDKFMGGQGQYDLGLVVSDLNKNEIYIGGVNIWKSSDGGSNWKKISHWQRDGDYPFVHADHHELVVPKNSNIVYSGHDGGIDKTTDGGKTWINLNGNLSIMQFYRLGTSEIDTNLIIAGAQDNGSSMYHNKEWTYIYGGDGFEAKFDPNDTTIAYCSLYSGQIFRSSNHGRSFETNIINSTKTKEQGPWLTAYVLAPSDPSNVFVGYSNLFMSPNFGDNFTKISNFSGTGSDDFITAIAVSHTNTDVIYVGKKSALYMTTNTGSDWVSIKPPGENISYIAIDPKNDKRIWVSMKNYTAGDKVWLWENNTWTNISGNLPNVPVNCIVYQADSPDRIYIGTDIGVYYSDYNSNIWETYGKDLPNVVVSELEITYRCKKLRAATYGRGIWEVPLNTSNLQLPQVTVTGNTEFCHGDSCILTAEKGFTDYTWSNGEKTQSIVVKETGVYSVTVENNEGKARSKGISIDVKPVNDMKITITGVNPMCNTDTLVLKAGFGFSEYVWSNGETTKEITVNTPGTYYVIGTAANGCTSTSDNLEVIVNPAPEKPVITREGNTLVSTECQFYQWLLDGEKIQGGTDRKQPITKNGSYSVIVTVGKSCSETSEPFVVLGVDDKIENDIITLAPNPAENYIDIVIKSGGAGTVSYKITDISGRIIKQLSDVKETGEFSKRINISDVSSGAYFVIVYTGGKHYCFKLIRS